MCWYSQKTPRYYNKFCLQFLMVYSGQRWWYSTVPCTQRYYSHWRKQGKTHNWVYHMDLKINFIKLLYDYCQWTYLLSVHFYTHLLSRNPYTRGIWNHHIGRTKLPCLVAICFVCAGVNTSINPVIYMVTNKRYRSAFMTVIFRYICKRDYNKSPTNNNGHSVIATSRF